MISTSKACMPPQSGQLAKALDPFNPNAPVKVVQTNATAAADRRIAHKILKVNAGYFLLMVG
jgi:hypothetical protein